MTWPVYPPVPTGTIQHPGTTPVPEYVPNPTSIQAVVPATNPPDTEMRAAVTKLKTLSGFPRIGQVLALDLDFKRNRSLAQNIPLIEELLGEVRLLLDLLGDPGVQRIVGLLRESGQLKDTA